MQRLIEGVRDRHDDVHVIVSPPRCASTAIARVFWQHPTVGFYAHEPFEVTYYRDDGLDEVAALLADPLQVSDDGRGLVVKEMPYQAGEHFPTLAAMATTPILFVLRDPRLNIASRIAKKVEGGAPPTFPLVETGWDLLAAQVQHCRDQGIAHLLVESDRFRAEPARVAAAVFAGMGLDFDEAMLAWQPRADIDLDNLGGPHRHLYARVLASQGIQPPDEVVPDLEDFPAEGGLRDHVAHCLELYRTLLDDPATRT